MFPGQVIDGASLPTQADPEVSGQNQVGPSRCGWNAHFLFSLNMCKLCGATPILVCKMIGVFAR